MQIGSNDVYADSGPPYLILLHPALGPLWEVTRQKVSSAAQILFSILSLCNRDPSDIYLNSFQNEQAVLNAKQ